MAVLNDLGRFHLVMYVIDRVPVLGLCRGREMADG
jgi:phosphoketolase